MDSLELENGKYYWVQRGEEEPEIMQYNLLPGGDGFCSDDLGEVIVLDEYEEWDGENDKFYSDLVVEILSADTNEKARTLALAIVCMMEDDYAEKEHEVDGAGYEKQHPVVFH